ncbi:hypothetical protein CDIK_2082 [Cucumispora dikerogammari]|nr:hypothetical protein CDIK_2082 [Cucumispora dikerogammari]
MSISKLCVQYGKIRFLLIITLIHIQHSYSYANRETIEARGETETTFKKNEESTDQKNILFHSAQSEQDSDLIVDSLVKTEQNISANQHKFLTENPCNDEQNLTFKAEPTKQEKIKRSTDTYINPHRKQYTNKNQNYTRFHITHSCCTEKLSVFPSESVPSHSCEHVVESSPGKETNCFGNTDLYTQAKPLQEANPNLEEVSEPMVRTNPLYGDVEHQKLKVDNKRKRAASLDKTELMTGKFIKISVDNTISDHLYVKTGNNRQDIETCVNTGLMNGDEVINKDITNDQEFTAFKRPNQIDRTCEFSSKGLLQKKGIQEHTTFLDYGLYNRFKNKLITNMPTRTYKKPISSLETVSESNYLSTKRVFTPRTVQHDVCNSSSNKCSLGFYIDYGITGEEERRELLSCFTGDIKKEYEPYLTIKKIIKNKQEGCFYLYMVIKNIPGFMSPRWYNLPNGCEITEKTLKKGRFSFYNKIEPIGRVPIKENINLIDILPKFVSFSNSFFFIKYTESIKLWRFSIKNDENPFKINSYQTLDTQSHKTDELEIEDSTRLKRVRIPIVRLLSSLEAIENRYTKSRNVSSMIIYEIISRFHQLRIHLQQTAKIQFSIETLGIEIKKILCFHTSFLKDGKKLLNYKGEDYLERFFLKAYYRVYNNLESLSIMMAASYIQFLK